MNRPVRIALIATVPSTLKAFYQPLIRALAQEGFELTLVSSPGTALGDLRTSEKVRACEVPLTRSISPEADAQCLVRLVALFRSSAFDVIHTHTPKAGLLGMTAGRIARVPYRIHTLHGLPLETATGVTRLLLTAADRTTCALAHTVCIVSESLRQRVLGLRLCEAQKMTILGDGTACGIDLVRFARTEPVAAQAETIRRRYDIPPQAVVIGFVGWLVADKGVTELVDVFVELARRRDNVHLLMIGADVGPRDPLPVRTRDTIREHPRVHYAGLVPDAVPYYEAMDLCVLPTRREGFPYAVLEAAAMEVPVVATRVTGCIDAVVDMETGLLVEPGSREALRLGVERLVDDPVLRTTLGAAAYRRVRDGFSSERLVKAHLELYRSIPSWSRTGH